MSDVCREVSKCGTHPMTVSAGFPFEGQISVHEGNETPSPMLKPEMHSEPGYKAETNQDSPILTKMAVIYRFAL
jgi:hypothetical protein